MTTINRTKVKELIQRENERYADERPKSRELFEQAQSSLIFGVPMAGMNEWVGDFPIYVEAGDGAYLTDVDGNRYLDLCLGDSGSMCGHTPQATIDAVTTQINRGFTFWLPTEDSIWVGKELTRRFGLPYWQVYLRASDANNAALSVARDVTQRYPIIVFNGSYHGHVPESRLGLMNDNIWPEPRGKHDMVDIRDGVVWRGTHAQGIEPTTSTGTRVIDFNDLDALEKALSTEDIACVLCEPAMTNVGIIMPDPGYHEQLRRLTRKYGTLLIIDETHTICGGPYGYTKPWKLEPDIYTIGKPVAGGIPTAFMGIGEDVQKVLQSQKVGKALKSIGGGTLSGNALSLAAARATLEHVLTEATYEYTISLCEKLVDGVDGIIKANDLPWHVLRLGCRAEWRWSKTPPRNGKEARAATDSALHELVHLYFMNRGILLTPPHSMVLIPPECTVEDIDHHNSVFAEFVSELV
ncbi:MAG: aminotransferase class III-fold pyridoxal phosphate-dependent enzyme [Chloroflexi bacterium]|jgi:glutamate-1-semialdehyde 2,1-aminomutase|nr:aminotransferase class III-fold pyridoxal phosphate-dependent enzyme [Chloroflexota bacterium]MBT7290859.1 aminotransferase class III-fold pyridoxal phosphate-dependent enzyme [Chloroflexota bacterium]